MLVLYSVFSCVCDVVPQSQHWQVGGGEGRKYSYIFTLISTSHVEQLCSSLSQTNYSMILGKKDKYCYPEWTFCKV